MKGNDSNIVFETEEREFATDLHAILKNGKLEDVVEPSNGYYYKNRIEYLDF